MRPVTRATKDGQWYWAVGKQGEKEFFLDTSLEMGQDDRTTVRNFASSPAARRGDKIKMALEKLA